MNSLEDAPQHPAAEGQPPSERVDDADETAVQGGVPLLRAAVRATEAAYFLAEMMLDADGEAVDYRLIETNEAFDRMTGLSQADGRTALELVPDLEQYWIDTYKNVAFTGEPAVVDHWSEALGRWFEGFAVAADGPGRFAVLFKDETARRMEAESVRRSEHRFRSMVDALPLMVWEHGPDGAQTWVSTTFCEYFGTTRAEMRADRWQALIHPDDHEQYERAFHEAIAERRAFRGRARVRNAPGEWRWLDSWGEPRFDAEGSYLGMVGTSADVTELVESGIRIRDSETFTRRVLDNLFTFVGVLSTDGALLVVNRTPLAIAGLRAADVLGRPFWDTSWWTHSVDVQQRLLDSIARALDGESVRYDTKVAARDGETIWIDFQLAPLRDGSGRISHLVASGYDITSRCVAEAQAAQSLANERHARQRIELLERTATHLAAATTRLEIAEALLHDLEESLGVDVAALDVVEHHHVVTLLSSGIIRTDHGAVAICDELPGPCAIADNATVLCHTQAEIDTRFPRLASVTAQHPVRTVGAFPLRNGVGTAIGALVVAAQQERWLDASTTSLLTSIANQAGQALDRAQLHERVLETSRQEHAIALQLQRALLPSRLVEHPGVEIAARYTAASDVLAVGGDWYDSYRWGDRYLGVTVGDIVGHDLDAATTMGRVRIAAGALMAFTEPDPAAILRVHDHCAREHGTFATAVSVVLDVETGALRFGLAGHPPPLVMASDGSVIWLADDPAPPLGVWPAGLQPSIGTATLAPGAVMLLYSDGLVEHRGYSIDDGMQQLSTVAARIATPQRSVEDILECILSELTAESGTDDDIIVVCVRIRDQV